MVDVIIKDVNTETTIATVTVAEGDFVPRQDDFVWVDTNGEDAFLVLEREHDFVSDETRLICRREPNKPRF